jgi:hypothetical protein
MFVFRNKLRDNNPAITDLNDPNRPMKIGEQFSGVYEKGKQRKRYR